MIIVSYDFKSNKKRTQFSKFLKKFGYRVQYSVFSIRNSQRVLNNILSEVNLKYKPTFSDCDSIYIFMTCESCTKKILKFGSARHEDESVVYFG